MSIIINIFNCRLSKLSYQTTPKESRSGDNAIPSQSKPPLPSNHQRSSASSNVSSPTTRSSQHRSSFISDSILIFSQFNIDSVTSKDDLSDENLLWKNEISPLIDKIVTAYQSI
jgi:hypothetical protein